MKNHRLIDICKFHQQLNLKRDVLIAGFQQEFPLGPNSPFAPKSTIVSTYLHDGDIDLESIGTLNMGIEEGEVRGMLSGHGSKGYNSHDFHKKGVLAHFNPN